MMIEKTQQSDLSEWNAKTPNDIRHDKIRQIHKLAENAFRDHTIEISYRHSDGLYRSWVCSNNGSSRFRFAVTTWHGWIAVTGDIDPMMWTGNYDMVPWVRGAINSIDYFEEKVPCGIVTTQWDPDIAQAWIKGRRFEVTSGDEKKCLDELELFVEDGEDLFENELLQSPLVDGEDFPNFRNFGDSFLWAREALLWWLEATK